MIPTLIVPQEEQRIMRMRMDKDGVDYSRKVSDDKTVTLKYHTIINR